MPLLPRGDRCILCNLSRSWWMSVSPVSSRALFDHPVELPRKITAPLLGRVEVIFYQPVPSSLAVSKSTTLCVRPGQTTRRRASSCKEENVTHTAAGSAVAILQFPPR